MENTFVQGIVALGLHILLINIETEVLYLSNIKSCTLEILCALCAKVLN